MGRRRRVLGTGGSLQIGGDPGDSGTVESDPVRTRANEIPEHGAGERRRLPEPRAACEHAVDDLIVCGV
jgi:hypothetical protein